MINIEALEKIAEIKTNEGNYILYLKEMYREKNNSYEYNNKVFICTWYNVELKEFFRSAYTNEETFIKYNYSVINTEFIQYIFDLVHACIKSYLGNDLSRIENINIFNNRFILNELKFKGE